MAYRTATAPELPIDLARLTAVHTERPTDRDADRPLPAGTRETRSRESRISRQATPRVIVGAAIISQGKVLACARSDPPEVAGRWEFPGGKVEPGEIEADALIRECAEELGVRVAIGERVGADVRLGHGGAVLKVYAARLVDGDIPQALEHAELRWLGPDELDTVPWLPADAPIVAALPALLSC
jgi:8-oxo-dGTP diphosphatase